MLRHMPPVSQMDANTSQARIFQERTNFKNLQGHDRVDWCIYESVPKSGTTRQENSYTDLPKRRKSERKMLRSPKASDSNLWPGSADQVLLVQEVSATARDEPLNGRVETATTPIHLPLRPFSQDHPSQRARADHALLSSFSPEAEAEADHKLKVAALTRVTSSLAAKASDAKQGAERLRKLLADRAVEPSIYEATQRERWMEERRQVATEELLKTVRDHLSSLVKSPASESAQTTTKSRGDSSVAANLHVFLTTPHRPATHSSSRRRRPYSAPRPEDAFNRIRHHKQLLPLRLKIPVVRPFSQPPPKATQNLATVTKDASSAAQPSASMGPAATNTTDMTSSSGASPSSLPPAAPLPAPLLEPILEKEEISIRSMERPPSPPNGNGIATIWRARAPRTKEEILAGADMVTHMPDYVQNLLAELDASPVGRVRLNSIRKSASFPRRPVSPPTAGRTAKRDSKLHARSCDAKRVSVTHARPHPPAQSPGMPSSPAPTPTHTRSNSRIDAPPSILASPSRRRISALFSLEMRAPRRSLNTVHTHSPPTNPQPSSTHLPALALVSPSIGFTIMESAQEAEEAEARVDVDANARADSVGHTDAHENEPRPRVASIPPSASAVTLSSVGTGRDARRSSVGVSTSNTEERMIARLRRRMSAALGRQ